MLWRTAPPTPDAELGVPGQLMSLQDDGLRIGTGHGSIVATSMSEGGQAPRPARAWFEDAGVTIGDVFDPVPEDESRWARGEGPRPVVPA
jgi:methionyl-tRNA formyltransferase